MEKIFIQVEQNNGTGELHLNFLCVLSSLGSMCHPLVSEATENKCVSLMLLVSTGIRRTVEQVLFININETHGTILNLHLNSVSLYAKL